jgi:molybdopterin-binding protein
LRREAAGIIMREARPRHNRAIEEGAMKISARNVLKGTVIDVKKGATTAHVRIDVKGAIVTASITNESVDDLKLVKGMAAYAVIKSSDVMVGVE